MHVRVRTIIARKGFWAVAIVAAACLFATTSAPAFATTFGSGPYGRCTYNGCQITLTSSSAVAVNVNPIGGGRCSIQRDIVSVETVNSSGYTLTMTGSTSNSNLVSGGNTIPVSSATQASPVALGSKQWGYRVDGVGGFGAGPTTAQSNITPGSTLFARVPNTSQSADTLASTASAASPAVATNVWYGVCADSSTPAGTYQASILYTAIVN